MKLDQGMRVDGQSIAIVKDKETPICMEYFFETDLWCEDPRFQSRPMKYASAGVFFGAIRIRPVPSCFFRWRAMMLEAGLTMRHRRCLRSFVPLGLGRTELSLFPDN
jgi:hypothetical protein